VSINLCLMIKDTKEALLLVNQKQKGNLSDLQSVIDSNLLERFRLLGYIRYTAHGWQITPTGVEELNFYSAELSSEEKEIVRFFETP